MREPATPGTNAAGMAATIPKTSGNSTEEERTPTPDPKAAPGSRTTGALSAAKIQAKTHKKYR